MTLYVGEAYITATGISCVLMAFAKDSETDPPVDLVVYRSAETLYWVLPAEGYEAKVSVPEVAPSPVFTVRMGFHEHFKHGAQYDVVCRARDPQTMKNLIVYRSTRGETWVRPEPMFYEEVTWPDGTRGPRFRAI